MKKPGFLRKAIPLIILCTLVVMSLAVLPVGMVGEKRVDPLTPAERTWLADHPVIRLAPDPSRPPLDIFDENDEYTGLSADYIALIEKNLGIKFQIVQLKTWEEVISAASLRKVDIVPSALMSPDRRQYLLFSEPYIKTPAVIITRNDVKENMTLSKLRGKRLVVVQGYAWQEMIAKAYPDINLVIVSDPAIGLRVISFGGADAMVNDEATSSYFIEREGLTNLQVSGETPYGGEMHFACRRDWPELQNIINKGLASIPPQQKQTIEKKWIKLGISSSVINERVLNIVRLSVEGLIAVLLLVVLWSWWQIRVRNRRLARELAERSLIEEEIRAKNQELQSAYDEINASYEQIGALSEELEKSNLSLVKYNQELSSVKERLELALWGAAAGMWDWHIQTGDLFSNARYAEIHGYLTSELPQNIADWRSRIYSDDWPYVRDRLNAHVEGRIDSYEAEYRIRNKENQWIWIHDSGKVVSWDDNNRPERALGIIREITGRKEMEFSLRESEQRYREVFDNTSDAIFLIDVTPEGEFRFMDFNPAQRKILGLPRFEYRGRKPEDLFPPQSARDLTVNYQRCLEAGTMISYEQVLNLTGTERYVHNSLIPITDAAGRIYRIIGIAQDITERHKNEAAARAEEKRLRSLVQISQKNFNSSQEILDFALDEVVTFSESRLGYISFYSEEDEIFRFYAWSKLAMQECAIDNPPFEFLLENTGLWGEAVRQRKAIIVNDYERDNIYKKGCPHGHVALNQFMTIPVFNDGKIVAVVGVANKYEDYTDLDARELSMLTDSLWKIVEIKRAEQALRLSEDNLSKVFYRNPVSMVIISIKARRLLEVNQAFEQRSGYRRGDISGQVISEIGVWPNQSSFDQLFRDLEVIGSSRGLEISHRTPGGKSWLLRVTADVIEFNAEPAALIVIEDITEQKKAEQALASSMALYRGIFTTTNNAALLLDINEFIILEANPAAERLYGYTMEEFKDIDFTYLNDTEPESVVEVIKNDIKQAWSQGSSTRRGLARRKDGQLLPVWVYLNIVPINQQYRLLVIINDLSDEIRFQEVHEKALRYEAQAMKMTTISVISAGVVHEISQPLNAIKVLADGILYRHEMGLNTDLHDALDTLGKISLQAERINDIVRHMSNLANSVEDKNYAAVDINHAVNEAMKILGTQLTLHGITMEINLKKNLPLVWGLEQTLEEVVINLIVNAMYALDEELGQDKRISCQTRQEPNCVVLEIADNGPGINEAIGNKMWEPFYSTRRRGTGMGLGLSIVKSIVSRLGGTIRYQNNVWGGATFRIEFPAYNEEV